jgi:hypothetical protein
MTVQEAGCMLGLPLLLLISGLRAQAGPEVTLDSSPPSASTSAEPRPTPRPRALAMSVEKANALLEGRTEFSPGQLDTAGVFAAEQVIRLDDQRLEMMQDGSLLVTGTVSVNLGSRDRYRTDADREAVDVARAAVEELRRQATYALAQFDSQWTYTPNRLDAYGRPCRSGRCGVVNARQRYLREREALIDQHLAAIAEADAAATETARQIDERLNDEKRQHDIVKVEVVVPTILLADANSAQLRKGRTTIMRGIVTNFAEARVSTSKGEQLRLGAVQLVATSVGSKSKSKVTDSE